MRISKNHGRTVITLSAMERRHLETIQDVEETVVALGGSMKDFSKDGVLVIDPLVDGDIDAAIDASSDMDIPGLKDDETVAAISADLRSDSGSSAVR